MLPGLGRAAVVTVLNDDVAVNLVNLNGVRIVRLVVYYHFVFELVRINRILIFLRVDGHEVDFLNVVMARVLKVGRCPFGRVAGRSRVDETLLRSPHAGKAGDSVVVLAALGVLRTRANTCRNVTGKGRCELLTLP